MIVGECKLCKRNSDLCDSHIIPEFFYKDMYDEKHRFYKFSTVLEEKRELIQKGFKESLLCKECELRLSKYEGYVSHLLKSNISEIVKYTDTILEGIDYNPMKLCQLSIFWRASVSSLDEFKNVNLGSHEEIIRRMLLDDNPGKSSEYGCLMGAILMNDNTLVDFMRPPVFSDRLSFKIYRFIFGGFIWDYIILNSNISFCLEKDFLLENGRLTIHKRKAERFKPFVDYGLELKRLGKI